jgi:hypothetical protein
VTAESKREAHVEAEQVPEDYEQTEAFKRYMAREQGCTVEEIEKWQKRKPPKPAQSPTA